MPAKQIVPQLGLESFSCPHCGAIAQQTWYKSYLEGFIRNTKPTVEQYDAIRHLAAKNAIANNPEQVKIREREVDYFSRLERNVLTYKSREYGSTSYTEMVNFAISHCFSCSGLGIWVGEYLIFPESEIAFAPHEEMPAKARSDFEEAASIVARSPRGAAALLRLCIQKLVIVLGQPGENLNADIRGLVEQGK